MAWLTACGDAGSGATPTTDDPAGTTAPDLTATAGHTDTDPAPTSDGPGDPTEATSEPPGETTTPTSDGDTDDTGEPGELGGPFRRGINIGYRNPNFSDPDGAWLAAEAGLNSMRVSLPETHLAKWGYDIEVNDIAAYAELGLDHHIAFIISPIPEHSTAPAGTPADQLAHYIPNKLHMV